MHLVFYECVSNVLISKKKNNLEMVHFVLFSACTCQCMNYSFSVIVSCINVGLLNCRGQVVSEVRSVARCSAAAERCDTCPVLIFVWCTGV